LHIPKSNGYASARGGFGPAIFTDLGGRAPWLRRKRRGISPIAEELFSPSARHAPLASQLPDVLQTDRGERSLDDATLEPAEEGRGCLTAAFRIPV
jgi:hypothetical protein